MSHKHNSRLASLHRCPGRCGREVPKGVFACKTCWRRLPVDLADPLRTRAPNLRAAANACDWFRANPTAPFR